MKVTHFAKKAAVIGSTLLTVFTAEANPAQKTDSGLSYTNAPSVKQEENSPRRRFLRQFIRGAASELAIGAANPLVDATLGGPSDFVIRQPDIPKDEGVVVAKPNQKQTQQEARKVTTQTIKTPVVGAKTTEHE